MENGVESRLSRLRNHPAVPAARFLFPTTEFKAAESPTWTFASRWFVLWGLVIGLVYLVVFRVSWKWFGEYQGVRWLPAAAVLAIDLGYCGYRLLAGLTQLQNRAGSEQAKDPASLTLGTLLAVMLVTITKYAMLLSLPVGRVLKANPMTDLYLPAWLSLLCPDEVIYRPLLLMPVWGRWAVALAVSIGRIHPSEPDRLRDMASGISLKTIFAHWFGLTVFTMGYCAVVISSDGVFITSGRTLAYGLLISMVTMLSAYSSGFVLARRSGGQTESTVCVAGLAAELAFLALYLVLASRIYWF